MLCLSVWSVYNCMRHCIVLITFLYGTYGDNERQWGFCKLKFRSKEPAFENFWKTSGGKYIRQNSKISSSVFSAFNNRKALFLPVCLALLTKIFTLENLLRRSFSFWQYRIYTFFIRTSKFRPRHGCSEFWSTFLNLVSTPTYISLCLKMLSLSFHSRVLLLLRLWKNISSMFLKNGFIKKSVGILQTARQLVGDLHYCQLFHWSQHLNYCCIVESKGISRKCKFPKISRELIFANSAKVVQIAKINSRENKFSRKLVLAKISTFKVAKSIFGI